ncbi:MULTISPECIES: class I SAM-dependent DNA methyltransferase [unclassified Modestobacter]|uniref:class I SAM-dependent DNA methyltransferase n=1 Tax=unclassified Modestobacter TaxID=2643866 RepID=UPI0022AAA455|nr:MULTISPECIES: class I SAM-dependent methyltransferase [unclassified Modestobacter]MCZ2827056.1 class I SAM-dependent methyltransferase [Modestobacter sp. VKM Ac-2981]MCZ2855249.1 class I SAM-dependent methyltransferase [Modestobacter sp. VKM Ac-2982]
MTELGDATDHLAETRAAYDTVAASYEELVRTALAESPMDRALLGVLAEQVRAAGGGPVGDLGCGPGRITAHLDALGVEAFGVDLSPGMVEIARRRHPQLRFEVGSLTGLPLPDGGLAGALAWYSVIHTAPERQPQVFGELARVLRPGAPLLVAFQAGDDDPVHHRQGYGHDISLHGWRLDPDRVEEQLTTAGCGVRTRVLREPEPPHEKSRQAYLLAVRA